MDHLPAAAIVAVALLFLAVVPAPAQDSALPGADPSSALELPDDLSPEAGNLPLIPEAPAVGPRYDDAGFPEDDLGLLLVEPDPAGYSVRIRGVSFPFLLYGQFVNRQRDAVFMARDGIVQDVLPDGTYHDILYGYGAVKTNTAYISVLEGIVIPHVSDNQKAYTEFPLQDLYVGATLGFGGLQAEVRYVERERGFAFARAGVNLLAAFNSTALAPLNWTWLSVDLGGGAAFPGLLENLLGPNHWSIGGDLHIGLGDADGNPGTPAFTWMPGVFFELEKRDLFGWADGWAGFGPQGDHRDDPRPQNYHVRALDARVGVFVDLQNGANSDSGWIKVDVSLGFRYNVVGPRIPEHPFKETRVVYVSEEYRRQIIRQRELRELRMKESAKDSGASP
jgi:hypothetical protein